VPTSLGAPAHATKSLALACHEGEMRIVDMNGKQWKSLLDFYVAPDLMA
jgi:hypothetical protein